MRTHNEFKDLSIMVDNSKIKVIFMHHLSCLGADKDYKNENISFYMTKCDENMTKSYQT